MARRNTTVPLCCLALALVGATSAASGRAPDTDARLFADEMFRGVGAEKKQCAVQVLDQVRMHEMQAVCAKFDGTFERFELRWNLQTMSNWMFDDPNRHGARPLAEPATEWESSGDSYDRIYRVGQTAVGVRFQLGDLIVVW